MKNILIAVFLAGFLLCTFSNSSEVKADTKFWGIQSIDTMKFSRDAARANLPEIQIETQIKKIADTGATHVAIDTPYDAEFIPVLKEWVNMARKYHLNVWFRGNFSGWEGWFDYPKDLTREQHLKLIENFILDNPDLFSDNDMFTACPECENGGPGDPRMTGDTDGFRKFIIDEYKTTSSAFELINKKVTSNYFSMNGDVARLIMDKDTVAATHGIITIDHYVSTPEKLVSDISDFAQNSNAKIMLGEFGAPIPDINGDLSESDQAKWVNSAFYRLVNSPYVIGLNYWTNMQSSTSPWNDDGSARQVVSVISSYYAPKVLNGKVLDNIGIEMKGVVINYLGRNTITDSDGNFQIPYTDENVSLTVFGPSGKTDMTVASIIKNKNKISVYRNVSLLEMIIHFFDNLHLI